MANRARGTIKCCSSFFFWAQKGKNSASQQRAFNRGVNMKNGLHGQQRKQISDPDKTEEGWQTPRPVRTRWRFAKTKVLVLGQMKKIGSQDSAPSKSCPYKRGKLGKGKRVVPLYFPCVETREVAVGGRKCGALAAWRFQIDRAFP
jgi:hypothetical protein